MSLTGLVNIRGLPTDVYLELEPASIQHADEINNDARTDLSVRNKYFRTADHALYRIEDGEAILYLGRKETNPFLKNIEELAVQFHEGYYVPSQEDIEAIVSAESTLRIKLSDLRLEIHPEAVLRISTTDYGGLNTPERALAERIYGQGENFEKNMKMHREKIADLLVFLLNPQWLKDNLEEGGAIAAACGFDFRHSAADFFAWTNRFDDQVYLRGIPHIPLSEAYKWN